MSTALHDSALDRFTQEELANRRLLMLAMKAFITDEISRLESLQPETLRTTPPTATTATPTCDGPIITPPPTDAATTPPAGSTSIAA